MTAVVVVDSAEIPLRYRVAPAIATVLATFEALGADVEDAVIWRGSPDLAYACVEVEGDYVVIRSEEPYCRYGVVEPLDAVNPVEVSVKLVKYSADYDVVGLLVHGRGKHAILDAEVYAPCSAQLLGNPPADAVIDVEAYFDDGKVESFYDMFASAYGIYANFVEKLAEKLAQPVADLHRPPTYFLDKIVATDDPYVVDDPGKSLPIFCKDFTKCVGLHKLLGDARETAVKIVGKTFIKVGELMLPKSPEAYKEFVEHLKRLIGS